MAIELRLTSPMPPDRVLDAIRENTREWRESIIPRELWNGGVLQVVSVIRPPKFTIYYDRRWQRSRGGDPLRLRGTVQSLPDGGSEINVRCGARGPGRAIAGLFVIFAAANLFLGGGTPWWIWLLVAALVLAADDWNDRAANYSDAETAYLVERLRQAIMQAGTPSMNAPLTSR